jgi:hypothetical protein
MNWDELGADFRNGGAPIAPDEVRRFRRRQQGKVAIEVVASAVLVGVAGWILSRSPPPAAIAILIAALLFVGVDLTYLFTNRAGLLRASASTTDEWLALLRKQADADLRLNRFATRVCIVAAIIGVGWAPWMFFTFPAEYMAAPWRAVVGFGGYFAFVGATLLWLRWKRRQLVARREALGAA